MDTNTPPAGISAEDWAATPLAVQQFLLATLSVVALHQQQIAQLSARLSDLEARLNQHSQNSSKPPSSDPPSAPPRRPRVPRGRKPGGQAGHPRHERPTPEPEQITTVEHHYPSTCPTCGDSVAQQVQDACAIQTQYVWELPLVQPDITAHHYHTICCRGCGALVTAERPPDVPPGAFGPRTAAVACLLHGRYRISQREVVNLFADLFQFPLSLGSIVSLQTTVSAALAPVYADVQTQVQAAAVVNVDETGWKEAGKRRVLWTVVGAVATLFLVASSRGAKILHALLGTNYGGIVGSDRGRAYLGVPPKRHQLCWAHLIRNFRALSERRGSLGAWAADWLALSEVVFQLWYAYRGGTIDRATLQATIEPIQLTMQALLIRGTRRFDEAEGISRELLAHWDALWTFVRTQGVEPTNNAAEQALRPAVLWRKGCFGAHSAEGNRFVERILTVSATCAQQQRHLLTFLTDAVDVYWRGQPAPTLV
jgi:transposase